MKQYTVLNTYHAEVNIKENPYQFKQHQLFDMALRINQKRSFLFVSKVLGKHLAVAPQIPLLTSRLLAHRYMEVRQQEQQALTLEIAHAIKTGDQLNEVFQRSLENRVTTKQPLTIIGFAETATALGHAFFESFAGDVRYVHTTREQLVNVVPTISFEEEHSHATSHRLYTEPDYFDASCEVVLVDDEMTTGKTNINIIQQLHKAYPHLTTFTLVTILDWRSEQHQQDMERLATELGITIHTVALLKGEFNISLIGELPQPEPTDYPSVQTEMIENSFDLLLQEDLVEQLSVSERGGINRANYYKGSGRFSLSENQQLHYTHRLKHVIEALKHKRGSGKCLVLGTGEFMYIPMYIAAQMGEGVVFHSTTRSPIYAHEQSLIYNKFTFQSAEYPGVTNYVYNLPNGEYEDIFIIYERILDRQALHTLANQLTPFAKNVHIITLGGVEIAEVFA